MPSASWRASRSVELVPAATGGAATSRGAIGTELEPLDPLGPLGPLGVVPLVAAAAGALGVEPVAALVFPSGASLRRCMRKPPTPIAMTIAPAPAITGIRFPSDLRR